MALFGPPDIEKLESRRDVNALLKAMQYFDQKNKNETFRIRAAACLALGRLQDGRAFERLVEALQYSIYPEVNLAAAEALGTLGDPRAMEPLLREFIVYESRSMWLTAATALMSLLQDPAQILQYGLNQPYVLRAAAVKRLAELDHPAAVPTLIAMIRDTPPHFRKNIAQALDRAGWEPDQGTAGAWYWIAKQDWDRCRLVGRPAIEPLLQAYFPTEPEAARHAEQDEQEQDWKRKDVELSEENRFAIEWRTENEQVLKGIETLIVEIGNEDALRWLQNMLPSPDLVPEKEYKIIKLIDRLGSIPASEKAKMTYWIMKQNWATLRQIGAASIGPLCEYVFQDASGRSYPGVLGAVQVLCSLRTPEAVPVLIRLLDHASKEIRILAAQSLIDWYKTEPFPEEIKALVWDQAGKISKTHLDTHRDFDYRIGEERCNLWGHASEHEDTGIGLDFPL